MRDGTNVRWLGNADMCLGMASNYRCGLLCGEAVTQAATSRGSVRWGHVGASRYVVMLCARLIMIMSAPLTLCGLYRSCRT